MYAAAHSAAQCTVSYRLFIFVVASVCSGFFGDAYSLSFSNPKLFSTFFDCCWYSAYRPLKNSTTFAFCCFWCHYLPTRIKLLFFLRLRNHCFLQPLQSVQSFTICVISTLIMTCGLPRCRYLPWFLVLPALY